MPTCILIGFEYRINQLSGTIIDLYHAYKWCRSFGCIINVLTDVSPDEDCFHDSSRLAVESSTADEGILTFYHELRVKTIKDKQDLLSSLREVLRGGIPDDKLIIYYSGHGERDNIVLPNYSLLPFMEFKETITGSTNPYVEIFWILDCCNPNGLNLAYKLKDNSFLLSENAGFISQPSILITSSESDEKSVATRLGSIFSRHLFYILTLMNSTRGSLKEDYKIPIYKNRNLRRLIGTLSSLIRRMHTGYTQTVSIYSSYMMDPVLWTWIGSPKIYDIVTDISLSVIVVRRSKRKEESHLGDIELV